MADASQSERDEAALQALFRRIAASDYAAVVRELARAPSLALLSARAGATRADATSYFLEELKHYVYAGDTALHIAAAAYAVDVVRDLASKGAAIQAANRRGAQPLHYAADGIPGSSYWNPGAQVRTIESLIAAGASPNVRDNDGVMPLHRAVRSRCAAAVGALLDHGAELRAQNQAGSTALHLAVQTTGRSGAGSADAKEQQARIIRRLIEHGARGSDLDARGKSVVECVKSSFIRELLERTD